MLNDVIETFFFLSDHIKKCVAYELCLTLFKKRYCTSKEADGTNSTFWKYALTVTVLGTPVQLHEHGPS